MSQQTKLELLKNIEENISRIERNIKDHEKMRNETIIRIDHFQKELKEQEFLFEELSQHFGLGKSFLKEKIYDFICNKDQGDGISKDILLKKFDLNEISLNKILDDLLKEIKIYKSIPGCYSAY